MRDQKSDKLESGEFLVNVSHLLPVQLKKVFREMQVVSLVKEKGEERNLEEEAMASLVSLT